MPGLATHRPHSQRNRKRPEINSQRRTPVGIVAPNMPQIRLSATLLRRIPIARFLPITLNAARKLRMAKTDIAATVPKVLKITQIQQRVHRLILAAAIPIALFRPIPWSLNPPGTNKGLRLPEMEVVVTLRMVLQMLL
jgi:hypothetical protein